MEVRRIVCGSLEEHCYLVVDPKYQVGFLVDPGEDPEAIWAAIQQEKLAQGILFIFVTHSHFDHVLGIAPLLPRLPKATVVCHADDVYAAVQPPNAVLPEGVRTIAGAGEAFEIGRLWVECLHTPGHTPGSTCYWVNRQWLFTGDTLFSDTIGRYDFPGGSKGQIYRSIRETIFSLPDETVVYPGHGGECLLGKRKADDTIGQLIH